MPDKPVRKLVRKKPTASGETPSNDKAVVIETKSMSTKDLQVYHRNPRIGDIGLIAKSLHKNGQYKPITVNLGTKTGRRNEVLAGNHTFLAARHLGWPRILVSVVNVDEVRAKKIVVADNATTEHGTYDPQALADLANSLPDLDGTAMTQSEIDALTKFVDKQIEDTNAKIEVTLADIAEKQTAEERQQKRDERLQEVVERRASRSQEEVDREEQEEADAEDDAYAQTEQRFRDVPEELPGTESLKEPSEVSFPGVGAWEIPELLSDMLVQWDEVPDNLRTWAGSASREVDQSDITWLWNWNIDSTSGMKDLSQMFVSFYAYDKYFDDWWRFADRYTAKLINMGVQGLLTPDWTMMNTRTESLMALFKSRWVGRYVQEAGIPVIPHISWPDGDDVFLRDYVLDTLPQDTPVIAMQLQTIDPNKVVGGLTGYFDMIQTVFDKVQPDGAVLYVGKQAMTMIEEGTLDIPVPYKALMARQFYLSQRSKAQKKRIIK